MSEALALAGHRASVQRVQVSLHVLSLPRLSCPRLVLRSLSLSFPGCPPPQPHSPCPRAPGLLFLEHAKRVSSKPLALAVPPAWKALSSGVTVTCPSSASCVTQKSSPPGRLPRSQSNPLCSLIFSILFMAPKAIIDDVTIFSVPVCLSPPFRRSVLRRQGFCPSCLLLCPWDLAQCAGHSRSSIKIGQLTAESAGLFLGCLRALPLG